jgi:tRNA 2-thiouridine synthesizing protein A
VGGLVGVVSTDAAARVDVPAWCRMRDQEYVGEDTADDGTPVYVVRRLS